MSRQLQCGQRSILAHSLISNFTMVQDNQLLIALTEFRYVDQAIMRPIPLIWSVPGPRPAMYATPAAPVRFVVAI